MFRLRSIFQCRIFPGLAPIILKARSSSAETRVHAGLLVISRCLHKQRLSRSLTLISNKATNNDGPQPSPPRLCIMLDWYLSKPEHVMKYAKLYLDQDFHVLQVHSSVVQILWPAAGVQIIAGDVLEFCRDNQHYESVLVHGFSIGVLVWGQMLVRMKEKPEIYGFMHEQVTGQIWDSPVDMQATLHGTGETLFPRNRMLKGGLEAIIRLYRKLSERQVWHHYVRGMTAFEYDQVRCPTLVYCSKDDRVASFPITERVARRWEHDGNYVRLKVWENSTHVQHMRCHPEEYLEELSAFLERCLVLKYPERLNSSGK